MRCSEPISWARQELNFRPLPCQQTAGNRCADARFRRSRSTVGSEVIVNALLTSSYALYSQCVLRTPTPLGALLHLAITAFDVPPLGSGTSPTILKIGRFGWGSGLHFVTRRRRPWPRCNSPPRERCGWRSTTRSTATAARSGSRPGRPPGTRPHPAPHRPCAPGQPRRRPRLPGRRERPRAAPPQPLTGSPRTPPPAQHRELVAQHEDLQVPGGVAADDRASSWMSWMKRHRQVGESRQHQVASVVGGSVTVPSRVSMRTRSSQATSGFPHPTGSSAGYHRRDWCRARRPLGATPDMNGVERCHRRCAWPGHGRRLTRPTLPYGRKAPRGGRLSSCRTTPFATCRWRG